ncbi:putative Protein kinase domain-containing protein [Seiridium cardinale]
MTTDRARRTAHILKTQFAKGGQYEFESHIGSGEQADVYTIRRANQAQGPDRVVVKIPLSGFETIFGGGNVSANEFSERVALQHLRGAAHVVQIIEPQGPDPLAAVAGSLSNGQWIYMEHLANGTLNSFLSRAASHRIFIPNRMIWRLMMCYVRMACALAWPNAHDPSIPRVEDPLLHIPPYVLLNSDMHSGNLMFGPLAPDSSDIEHGLVPILKMIDLGLVRKRLTPDPAAFDKMTKEFVKRIGREVERIAAVGRGHISDQGVDPDLRSAVLASQREEDLLKPSLRELATVTAKAIQERDAAWYGRNMPTTVNPANEDDPAIRQI